MSSETATGTTQSAIARLEAGRSDPKLSTLLKIAEAVDLDNLRLL
jgi:predicted transcriptional regulator